MIICAAVVAAMLYFWQRFKRGKHYFFNEEHLRLERANRTLEAQREMQDALLNKYELEIASFQEHAIKTAEERASMEERIKFLSARSDQLDHIMAEKQELYLKLLTTESQFTVLKEKYNDYHKMDATMQASFENVARKIFDENRARFSEQSRTSLMDFLAPFKQQLDGFKKQVELTYGEESRERRALQHEIRGLKELNKHIAEEAVNLTRALKGDKKLQGNWGELVLERILNESGLREGHEYSRQPTLVSSEGQRQQPDIIVHLPDNKNVIIDAKVSLVDYSRYNAAENDAERQSALKAHLTSLKNHIRNLGSKHYEKAQGVFSLDYVLMFVSIEAAFYAAIEAQGSLFQEALKNNVMLVGPTNLLVALKTIHHLWQQERQHQNTQKIVHKAGALYDKIQGLTTDMMKLGLNLDTACRTYDGAMNKFKLGKGNLIKQAQDFVDLGISVKKEFDIDIMQEAVSISSKEELLVDSKE